MGVYAKYYKILADQLSQKGISVGLVDLRGNDTSSVRPSRRFDFGYRDQIELEYNEVVKSLKEEHPKLPIYLFGHSLGGQLSCLYTAKYPELVSGLILSATCSVYYKGWDGFGAYRILAGTQFANLVAKMLGYYPGKKVGFGGTEAKTLIKDWSSQSRTGKYILQGDSFNYEEGLSKITLPVLAISYEGDKMAPIGAVDHLLSKMTNASKEHIHLKKSDPRNDGFNHFNWAKKTANVVDIVLKWMNTTSA
jgi:predicted alpha/beta hydrolase